MPLDLQRIHHFVVDIEVVLEISFDQAQRVGPRSRWVRFEKPRVFVLILSARDHTPQETHWFDACVRSSERRLGAHCNVPHKNNGVFQVEVIIFRIRTTLLVAESN